MIEKILSYLRNSDLHFDFSDDSDIVSAFYALYGRFPDASISDCVDAVHYLRSGRTVSGKVVPHD